MKGCLVCKEGGRLPYVYRDPQMKKLASLLELCPAVITRQNVQQYRSFLQETEVLFCTWDMIPFPRMR